MRTVQDYTRHVTAKLKHAPIIYRLPLHRCAAPGTIVIRLVVSVVRLRRLGGQVRRRTQAVEQIPELAPLRARLLLPAETRVFSLGEPRLVAHLGQVAPQVAVALPNRVAHYRSQQRHAQVHAQLARLRNVSVWDVPLGRVMNRDSLLGISVPKCILRRSIRTFLFALRGRTAAIASQSWIPSFPIG